MFARAAAMNGMRSAISYRLAKRRIACRGLSEVSAACANFGRTGAARTDPPRAPKTKDADVYFHFACTELRTQCTPTTGRSASMQCGAILSR